MRRSGNRLLSTLRSTRGAALILVVASMFAIAAAAAIAIDIGMLTMARTESQRASDAAALAGAGWLITAPDDAAGARARAQEYALQNGVRGTDPVLLDEDVYVDLDSALVRVWTHHVEDRGTAMPTFFARVFGVDRVDIRTMATAWAAPVGENTPVEGRCLLPIALPDRWTDTNDDGVWQPGEAYDPQGTGIGDYDVGELVVMKVSGSDTQGPKSCREESPYVDIDLCKDLPDSNNWRCWYREGPKLGGGATVVGERIFPGTNCGPPLSIGEPVYAASASGNMQSLVNGEFASLVNSDPGLEWCDPDGPGGNAGFVCRNGNPDLKVSDSPRIRAVPLVNPTTVTGTGADATTDIVDFTGVFVERVACNYDLGDFGGPSGNWNVYMRIMRTGTEGGGGDDETEGPGGTTNKKLQLIE